MEGLSLEERKRRKAIVDKTRSMVLSQILVEGQDETSLLAEYRGFYLQVSFSVRHPLILFGLVKALEKPGSLKQQQILNELNLRSILGSHTVNEAAGCYAYRAAHWLETELEPSRFWEMLNRCTREAEQGYRNLTDMGCKSPDWIV